MDRGSLKMSSGCARRCEKDAEKGRLQREEENMKENERKGWVLIII